jgi:acetyltransferase EpsM
MRNLIIFGAIGHARVIADAARRSGSFNVLGFVEQQQKIGGSGENPAILGSDADLANILSRADDIVGIVGVGGNAVRARIAAAIMKNFPSFEFANVIHPSAEIAGDVKLGKGVFVAASATIICGTTIGDHVIVNTSASVDHDCSLGDFSFVAPGATLAGGVKVGHRSFIGTGASVIQYLDIGDDVVVGAGSVVIRSIPSGSRVVGVPATPQTSSETSGT